MLAVFTGLPGTGKSTLAERAARVLGCPVFGKDVLEAALRRSGIGPDTGVQTGWAGYELLNTLAKAQLRLGQSAVLDSVATFESIRTGWRELASRYSAAFLLVECVCSDEALHQRRIEGRKRNIPGWHELTWEHVQEVRGRYEPARAGDPKHSNAASLGVSESLGAVSYPRQLTLDAVDDLDRNLARLELFLRSA